MIHPPGETQEQREAITMQALSDVVRYRINVIRWTQANVAARAGVSRALVQTVLNKRGCSFFLILELCYGLSVDPIDLLRDVLNRRDEIRQRQVGGSQ